METSINMIRQPTEEQTASADAAQKADNDQRVAVAIAAADKYKKANNPVTGNYDTTIESFQTSLNEATADLQQYKQPGETDEQAVQRGLDAPIWENSLLSVAAKRVVHVSKQLISEQGGREQKVFEKRAGQLDNLNKEFKQARKMELRASARRIAQSEGIPLADAFTIAVMEIQADGLDVALPNLAKVRANAAKQFEALQAEEAAEREAAGGRTA